VDRRRLVLQDKIILTLMVCPVTVLWFSEVEIPATDFALLAGAIVVPTWTRFRFPRTAVYILMLVTWSALALAAVSLEARSTPFGWRGLYAFLFYIRPLLAILIGWGLMQRRVSSAEVVRWLGASSAVLLTMIGANLVVNGQPHLVWGPMDRGGTVAVGLHLTSSLWGQELFGRYGVNGLASVFAVMTSLCLVKVLLPRSESWRAGKLLASSGLVAGTYLVISAGSRAASGFLALVLLAAVALRPYRGRRPRKMAALALLGALSLTLIMLVGYQPEISSIDLDEVSTGRVSIARETVKISAERPVFGTGFYGSTLVDAEGDRINPHNLLLATTLKAGWPAAALVVVLLASLARVVWIRLTVLVRHGQHWPEDYALAVAGVAAVGVFAVMGLAMDTLALTPTAGPALLILAALTGDTVRGRNIDVVRGAPPFPTAAR
jgi:hypothetical protein